MTVVSYNSVRPRSVNHLQYKSVFSLEMLKMTVQSVFVWNLSTDERRMILLLQLYEMSDDVKRKEFLDELFTFMQKRGELVNSTVYSSIIDDVKLDQPSFV